MLHAARCDTFAATRPDRREHLRAAGAPANSGARARATGETRRVVRKRGKMRKINDRVPKREEAGARVDVRT